MKYPIKNSILHRFVIYLAVNGILTQNLNLAGTSDVLGFLVVELLVTRWRA